MGCTLVIDTSYGSTVGLVGREPIVETDSRTHVEKLQGNIARAVGEAGLTPRDVTAIVVGVGPAPFTGLRAGIVAAKALAFATGATLIGQNVLEPQTQWNMIRRAEAGTLGDVKATHVLTLAVNDARRKQLYFELCPSPFDGDGLIWEPEAVTEVFPKVACDGDAETVETGQEDVTSAIPEIEPKPRRAVEPLISMDIDYPASIVERVNEAVRAYVATVEGDVVVDVVGHGVGKYEDVLHGIERLGDVVDESVLDRGGRGLSVFAAHALATRRTDADETVEPLYLRRPDAEVPNPLKHVLGHTEATRR